MQTRNMIRQYNQSIKIKSQVSLLTQTGVNPSPLLSSPLSFLSAIFNSESKTNPIQNHGTSTTSSLHQHSIQPFHSIPQGRRTWRLKGNPRKSFTENPNSQLLYIEIQLPTHLFAIPPFPFLITTPITFLSSTFKGIPTKSV